MQEASKDYAVPDLTPDKVHVVQYHMGQIVLEKKCPYCGDRMILQHPRPEVDPMPSFEHFRWACVSYYQKPPPHCETIPFVPSDIILFHPADIPELAETREDLELVANQPIARQTIQKRVRQHIGSEDEDILCPRHHLAMTLHERPFNRTGLLIDVYYLKCPHKDSKAQIYRSDSELSPS